MINWCAWCALFLNSRLLFGLTFLVAVGCTPSSKKAVEVKNGNVSIAYTLSGKGDTAIVLVHGWCITKEYWDQTQKELSTDYTVVALDLGGHGQSGSNRDQWTIEEYANDVLAVINQLDLKNVILVGHSMGGQIILQAALTQPSKIIGFIGVDNFKDFFVEFTAEEDQGIKDFMQDLRASFDTTATRYCKVALFPPNYVDTAAMNRVIRSVQLADSIMAIQSLESAMLFTLIETELMPKLTITVHLIVSEYTPTHEEKLRMYAKAGYSIRTISGVGHYPMIEKPVEFNLLLQATIREIGIRP